MRLANKLAVKIKKAHLGECKLLRGSQSTVIMTMKIAKVNLILRRLCPTKLLSQLSYLINSPETKLITVVVLNEIKIHLSSK
jgi:hypothetical protein